MKWFKHYSNSSEGLSLSTLWANKDYEAIAVFWRFCEIVARHGFEEGFIETNWLRIGREMGMKPTKCRRVFARISSVSLLRYEHDTDEIQRFLIPKWSEFQDFRCLKQSIKNSNMSGDIRSKNKDKRYKNLEVRNIVSTEPKDSVAVQTEKVSKDSFKDFFNEKLSSLYPQEYLDREKTKMEIWLVSNPQKNPKSQRGWTRFITGWLERGWEQYRKTLQTQAPKKKNWMEMVEEEERAKQNGENTV